VRRKCEISVVKLCYKREKKKDIEAKEEVLFLLHLLFSFPP
jgi:hypothetical protein